MHTKYKEIEAYDCIVSQWNHRIMDRTAQF
jgi:hypothetical protein